MSRQITLWVSLCGLLMLTGACDRSAKTTKPGSSDGESAPGGWLADELSAPAAKPATYKGPKLALTIRFTPGQYVQTEAMEQTMKQVLTAEGNDQTMKTKSSVRTEGDLDVRPPAADSSEQTILYTCTRVKITEATPMGSKSFDSAAPADSDKELKFLQSMVGRKLTQTYDARTGKFLRLEGLESMFSQMAAGLGGRGRMAMGQIRKMLEPLFKEMLTKHWGALIPAEPVGPGDTWTRRVEVDRFPMFGPVSFDFACRLQDFVDGPRGKVAIIECNGKADLSGRQMKLPGAAAGMRMETERVDLRQRFEIRFDTGVGLCTSLDGKVNMQGQMRISPPGGAEVMSDMDMDSTMKITLEPKGAP